MSIWNPMTAQELDDALALKLQSVCNSFGEQNDLQREIFGAPDDVYRTEKKLQLLDILDDCSAFCFADAMLCGNCRDAMRIEQAREWVSDMVDCEVADDVEREADAMDDDGFFNLIGLWWGGSAIVDGKKYLWRTM